MKLMTRKVKKNSPFFMIRRWALIVSIIISVNSCFVSIDALSVHEVFSGHKALLLPDLFDDYADKKVEAAPVGGGALERARQLELPMGMAFYMSNGIKLLWTLSRGSSDFQNFMKEDAVAAALTGMGLSVASIEKLRERGSQAGRLVTTFFHMVGDQLLASETTDYSLNGRSSGSFHRVVGPKSIGFLLGRLEAFRRGVLDRNTVVNDFSAYTVNLKKAVRDSGAAQAKAVKKLKALANLVLDVAFENGYVKRSIDGAAVESDPLYIPLIVPLLLTSYVCAIGKSVGDVELFYEGLDQGLALKDQRIGYASLEVALAGAEARVGSPSVDASITAKRSMLDSLDLQFQTSIKSVINRKNMPKVMPYLTCSYDTKGYGVVSFPDCTESTIMFLVAAALYKKGAWEFDSYIHMDKKIKQFFLDFSSEELWTYDAHCAWSKHIQNQFMVAYRHLKKGRVLLDCNSMETYKHKQSYLPFIRLKSGVEPEVSIDIPDSQVAMRRVKLGGKWYCQVLDAEAVPVDEHDAHALVC